MNKLGQVVNIIIVLVIIVGCTQKTVKIHQPDWDICGKSIAEISLIYGNPKSTLLLVSNGFDMNKNPYFYPVKSAQYDEFTILYNKFDVAIYVGVDIPVEFYLSEKIDDIVSSSKKIEDEYERPFDLIDSRTKTD